MPKKLANRKRTDGEVYPVVRTDWKCRCKGCKREILIAPHWLVGSAREAQAHARKQSQEPNYEISGWVYRKGWMCRACQVITEIKAGK